MNDKLVLAPMLGITDAIYRNTYHKHFKSFDEIMAPYISAHGEKAPRISILEKLYQQNNPSISFIPQLIGNNAKSMIIFCRQLYNLNYNTINWNLGCPVPIVTRKKKGSGLLPFPDDIRRILDEIIPSIHNKLSIKIRLGLNDKNEIYKVLEVLNDFPLSEIIIHPRTANQLYTGTVFLNEFDEYLKISKNPIQYNGDIFSVEKFHELKQKFPQINKWMIGRGMLRNPLLPDMIKNTAPKSKKEQWNCFIKFYNDLYQQYLDKSKNPDKLVPRLKELWSYQSQAFENSTIFFDSIKTAQSLNDFNIRIEKAIKQHKWLP